MNEHLPGRYPHGVTMLERLRERLPFVVFVLLLVLSLVVLGVLCACMSDHPVQAIERALFAVASLPALLEVWSFALAAFVATALLYARPRPVTGRASPAVLQRFIL